MAGAQSTKQDLLPIYQAIEQYEATPDEGYLELNKLLPRLGEFTAGPDIWFNLAASAGRVRNDLAQFTVAQYGLQEHPDNVDLLCSQFAQFYSPISLYYSQERAKERWEYLQKLDVARTYPYWRFWTYGARFHARELNQVARSIQLLDMGMQYVRRDTLFNVLRIYRTVLLDNVLQIHNFNEVGPKTEEAVDLVEKRYRLGISLGIENSYVLAQELALLYQERAGCEIGVDGQPRRDYLDEALKLLALAEKLYTANGNFPIFDTYLQRARIQMSLHNYSQVIAILRSLPASIRRESSTQAMLNLAYYLSDLVPPEDNAGVIPYQRVLADTNLLEQALRQNQNYVSVVVETLKRMSGDDK